MYEHLAFLNLHHARGTGDGKSGKGVRELPARNNKAALVTLSSDPVLLRNIHNLV